MSLRDLIGQLYRIPPGGSKEIAGQRVHRPAVYRYQVGGETLELHEAVDRLSRQMKRQSMPR